MFAVRFFHLSRGLVQLRRWEPLTRTLCSVLGPRQIPGEVLAAACEVLEDKKGYYVIMEKVAGQAGWRDVVVGLVERLSFPCSLGKSRPASLAPTD